MFPTLGCRCIHSSLLLVCKDSASTMYKVPQFILKVYKEAEYTVLYSESKIYSMVVDPCCTHMHAHCPPQNNNLPSQ